MKAPFPAVDQLGNTPDPAPGTSQLDHWARTGASAITQRSEPLENRGRVAAPVIVECAVATDE